MGDAHDLDPHAPSSRPKLAEVVAAKLLDQIRREELRIATRIPSERKLMASLGVGRSTIREAIHGLAMLGVLEIRHGRGVFVIGPGPAAISPISIAVGPEQTHDLLEARRVVEPGAARRAAARRTDSDLVELREIVTEHARAVEAGASTVAASIAFHQRIADASGNEVLAKLVAAFAPHLAERGIALQSMPGFAAWDLAEHEALLEAIAANDPVAAEARMRGHLDGIVRHQARLDGQ